LNLLAFLGLSGVGGLFSCYSFIGHKLGFRGVREKLTDLEK
jgi:hypothetical protein